MLERLTRCNHGMLIWMLLGRLVQEARLRCQKVGSQDMSLIDHPAEPSFAQPG
ncbi:hypothetical protein THTE_3631 [Thermogutta terrifontis]|uniref:Uncharacterized protein n=1 Tax=Thermogutta terrifontis TaxID=1331910 RepID=A0A286RJY3_9BACT|nr:hypothetical protein THTE_3631 [Thermogutta terrifontis]